MTNFSVNPIRVCSRFVSCKKKSKVVRFFRVPWLPLYSTLLKLVFHILETNSRRLQANTAAALSALTRGNCTNQDLIASIPGAVKGLVELVNSKNSVCQVKAASAIESLTQSNFSVQRLVEDAGAVRPLIRLLKIWSIEVKEQGIYYSS